jgi:hypothetical protein
MGTAKQIGCPLISIWPGQDGFDYPFSMDYLQQMTGLLKD